VTNTCEVGRSVPDRRTILAGYSPPSLGMAANIRFVVLVLVFVLENAVVLCLRFELLI
jgi:hypothetical protein